MNNITSYLSSFLCDKFNLRRNPVVMNFPITDNCNSRCVMCNVWVDKVEGELTVDEIEEYFQDPLFSSLMHVGISGGEPTLRRDLVQCLDKIVSILPNIKTLSITTHGYHYKRWARFLPKIIEITQKKRVSFSLNISLDGVGIKHDEIRGTKGAFIRATKTAKLALALNVPVQFQCTVSKANLYNIGKVLRYAKSLKADIVFRKAVSIERLHNLPVINNVCLDKYEDSYLADFFTSSGLLNYTKSRSRRIYYRKMAETLENGGERNRPCHFQRQGVFLGSKGDLFNCSLSDTSMGNITENDPQDIYFSLEANEITNNLIFTTCKTCMHDQGGAWSPKIIFSDALLSSSKVFKVYLFVSKSISTSLRLLQAEGNLLLPQKNNKADVEGAAYVIGAYGGEHVGDSAILGGVCLRVYKKYKIKKIFIESFRVNRTRKWVESLKLPVQLLVVEYGSRDALKAFKEAGLVVYGGGPLMELPFQLAKHYLTISKARKQNKSILIEGVGIGPIKTKLSEYIVTQLLSVADVITVRTPEALAEVERIGEEAELSGDPAFDYLKYRKSSASMEVKWINEWINSIIKPEEQVVGINLRPLWEKYNFSGKGQKANIVYEKFIKEISNGMSEYSELCDHKLVYIFIPLNPDQYGFSDLDAAYDLEENLGENVHYHILEYEPNVDELIEVLRHIDSMISMRFHGCIFALSQNVANVIGVDYQIGKQGKVSEIMNSYGLSENVVRVDELSSSWLIEKLGN